MTPMVQQAVLIQFDYQAHHRWAVCPLCLTPGPTKEDTIRHLNQTHSVPGDNWELLETREVTNGFNVFWVALRMFYADRVQRTSAAQDQKAVDEIAKAQVLPQAVLERIQAEVRAEQDREAIQKRAQEGSARPLPAPPVHVRAKPALPKAPTSRVRPDKATVPQKSVAKPKRKVRKK